MTTSTTTAGTTMQAIIQENYGEAENVLRLGQTGGTLVIVGGETRGRWLGGSDRQLRAVMLSPFTRQQLGTLLCSENQADLLALTRADRVRPGHTGHRQDLPAEPDHHSHPGHARRSRPGQGRHNISSLKERAGVKRGFGLRFRGGGGVCWAC
jgi:hypothetical protein